LIGGNDVNASQEKLLRDRKLPYHAFPDARGWRLRDSGSEKGRAELGAPIGLLVESAR
jgi:hypothetical protein